MCDSSGGGDGAGRVAKSVEIFQRATLGPKQFLPPRAKLRPAKILALGEFLAEHLAPKERPKS